MNKQAYLLMRGSSQIGSFKLSFDLSLEQNQTLIISGKNGSGKTTLLKTLAGILPLASGEIFMDEQILDSPASRHFTAPQNRNVVMVFSEPRLFDFMDLAANTAFGLRQKGIPKNTAGEIARCMLAELGLKKYADKKPSVLSRGQAQKASLARALVLEPEVLLLDEPLAGVDADSRTEILQKLQSLQTTKFYVTHNLDEAKTIGDKFYELGNEKNLNGEI